MTLRASKNLSLLFLLLVVTLLSSLSAGCVKLAHSPPSKVSQFAPTQSSAEAEPALLVNINTASKEELEKLPGIGRALAARIITFREQYGRFRRAEHLIMVRGIGERRFRRLRPFITA